MLETAQIILLLITGMGLFLTVVGIFEKNEFIQRLGIALILIGIFVIQFGAIK